MAVAFEADGKKVPIFNTGKCWEKWECPVEIELKFKDRSRVEEYNVDVSSGITVNTEGECYL